MTSVKNKLGNRAGDRVLAEIEVQMWIQIWRRVVRREDDLKGMLCDSRRAKTTEKGNSH